MLLFYKNLDLVRLELEKLEAESDHKGYGIYRICCLLLQFLENLWQGSWQNWNQQILEDIFSATSGKGSNLDSRH